MVKISHGNVGGVRDEGSDPWIGRSPGGRHGNLLQYSCLENPMDRGAWRATDQGVTKEQDMTEATQHAYTKKTLLKESAKIYKNIGIISQIYLKWDKNDIYL